MYGVNDVNLTSSVWFGAKNSLKGFLLSLKNLFKEIGVNLKK